MIESVTLHDLDDRRSRARTARTLIETTAMPFADVALAAGFSSVRRFNDTVRAVYAATPTELRLGRRGGAQGGLSVSIRLPYRVPLDRDHLVGFLARRTVEGVASVAGDAVHTSLRLPGGEGVATMRFAPDGDPWVLCDLDLASSADLASAVAACRALLDLDADPEAIDPTLAAIGPVQPLVEARPGLRSPGSVDGFAALVLAILGQQRSVAAARTLAGRIVQRARGPACGPHPEGEPGPETEGGGEGGSDRADRAATARLEPFPGPEALADLDLDGIGLTRRTVATIAEVATRFAGRTGDLGPGADRGALRVELVSITGIGPWTANYLAMRALGDPDVFLAGDLVADRAASRLGLTPERIDDARPWRSYLTHHLWAASADLADPGAKRP